MKHRLSFKQGQKTRALGEYSTLPKAQSMLKAEVYTENLNYLNHVRDVQLVYINQL